MNFPSPCLYFLTAGITGENHHTWRFIYSWHRVELCSPGWPLRVDAMVGGGGTVTLFVGCQQAMEKASVMQRPVKTILTVCCGAVSAFMCYGKARDTVPYVCQTLGWGTFLF